VICNIKFLIHVSRTAMIGWFNNLEIMEFVGQFLETIELLGTAEFGSSVTPQCFSLFIKCFLIEFFFHTTGKARFGLISQLHLKNSKRINLLHAVCKTVICSNHPDLLLKNSKHCQ
jgi:hypothetical protein